MCVREKFIYQSAIVMVVFDRYNTVYLMGKETQSSKSLYLRWIRGMQDIILIEKLAW